jgi:hypothetical protein
MQSTDRVNPANEPSHPDQGVSILKFWRAPALAGVQRKHKPAMLAQRSTSGRRLYGARYSVFGQRPARDVFVARRR